MDVVLAIIILIVSIAYLVVLIPSFMFAWEGDLYGIGLSGWFCLLVGFPGALLALLIKLLIRVFGIWKEAAKNVDLEKAEANIESALSDIEKEERFEREEWEKKRMQEAENAAINRIINSKSFSDVIGFVTKRGLPIKIVIKYDHIVTVEKTGAYSFDFLSHGIKSFEKPMPFISKGDSEKMIYLGKAINQKLGNIYRISSPGHLEKTQYNEFDSDCDWIIECVELTQKLESF